MAINKRLILRICLYFVPTVKCMVTGMLNASFYILNYPNVSKVHSIPGIDIQESLLPVQDGIEGDIVVKSSAARMETHNLIPIASDIPNQQMVDLNNVVQMDLGSTIRYLVFNHGVDNVSKKNWVLWKNPMVINIVGDFTQLVGGDFNTIYIPSERLGGSRPLVHSMDDFNNMIMDCNLVDIGYTGSNFTWNLANLWQRLDWVLSNDSLINSFSSMHLNSSSLAVNFHFQNIWLLDSSFMDIVKDNWQAPLFPNNSIFGMNRLWLKLKKLKYKFNWWHRNVFKDIFTNIIDAEEKEETFWKQKTTLKHRIDGDNNTKYFHAIVKRNRTKNWIHKINFADGSSTEDVEKVALLGMDFYKGLFNKTFNLAHIDTPNIIPHLINQDDNLILITLPTLEEVRKTVFELHIDSVAGPHGFTTNSFQKTWDIIHIDHHSAISNFFSDDVIIYLNASINWVKRLMSFLSKFETFSGLSINNNKSYFIISKKVSNDRVSAIHNCTGFPKTTLPIKNLGVPIYKGRKTTFLFDDLISNVHINLFPWNSNFLSFGGRLTLIKSVLCSLPVYIFQTLQPTHAVCNRIEKLINKFFWRGSNGNCKCYGVLEEGDLGCKSMWDLWHVFSYKLWFNF
ncbi:hypothetical protein M5K25_016230 [Dendrobium thyrsiflorum]|uniref:Uncharacterized protein n=1 Tax=Dendrobium thyrsiflorum TaxID=117978 RepID=A0ABD0UR83_DENTH